MARPKKRLVQHNSLVQAIEMATPKNEIMEKFGIKTYSQFKLAYIDALLALGMVTAPYQPPKSKPVNKTVSVNARGSLTIPKALVAELDLDLEATFEVEKSVDGISIQPVEKTPMTILRKKPVSAVGFI